MYLRLQISRWIVLVAVMALVAAACGDDDSGSDTEAPATQQTTQPSTDDGSGGDGGSEDGPSDDTQDAIDELDFGDGGAVVTIGDTTYELALGGNSTVGNTTYIGVCQTLFGVILGEGFDPEGRDITISIEIPPEDYAEQDFDPPVIEVEDNTDGEVTWVADQTLQDNFPETAGMSQVDSWTTDGTVATGTATFLQVEPFGAPIEGATPVEGTFQVGCAE